MGKAERRIDYAKFPGGPGFELNERQRAEVEEKYGRAIQPEVWKEIFEATSHYTIAEAAIQNSPSLEEIDDPITKFLEASICLRETISARSTSVRDPFQFDKWIRSLPGASKGNPFDLYVVLLDWIISYTERIRELHEAGYHIGFKGSGLWQHWIRDLIQIMERNGLRYGASPSKVSKFAILIRELQNQMKVDVHTKHTLPEKLTKQKELEIIQLSKCIRHAQSDRALTDAIIAAKGQDRNKVRKKNR